LPLPGRQQLIGDTVTPSAETEVTVVAAFAGTALKIRLEPTRIPVDMVAIPVASSFFMKYPLILDCQKRLSNSNLNLQIEAKCTI
jgi:hypothetical protein